MQSGDLLNREKNMGQQLEINPSDINDAQRAQLQVILDDSRAIFSADGRRESRDNDSSDTLHEFVTSAPGGSYKRALQKSLEPGNPPLLRLYDRVSVEIPGFKLATVNLEMSYRAVARDIVKEGRRQKQGEVLTLDKKTRYYEAIIRHQVNRKDPEQPPLQTNLAVPLEELLTQFESRITERFRYSDNPEGTVEHALGLTANWYRPLGELSVDDSLNRLSTHIGYILKPGVIVPTQESQQADSLSA